MVCMGSVYIILKRLLTIICSFLVCIRLVVDTHEAQEKCKSLAFQVLSDSLVHP